MTDTVITAKDNKIPEKSKRRIRLTGVEIASFKLHAKKFITVQELADDIQIPYTTVFSLYEKVHNGKPERCTTGQTTYDALKEKGII